MARRFDISDKLIHFTRGGECVDDAFSRLRAIIREGRLIGNSRMIRGGYRCLSFTEAPLPAFTPDFIREFPFTRYSPFGLMFEKNWIFGRGGRPVIYQPDGDFDLLPEDLRWRPVRFEPTGEKVIDWTWEREWRVRCDELAFTPAYAVIVVPNDCTVVSNWRSSVSASREMSGCPTVNAEHLGFSIQRGNTTRVPSERWQMTSLQAVILAWAVTRSFWPNKGCQR